MRTSWSSLPLLAISLLLGCPDDGTADTSTTGPTTTLTDGPETSDTNGDGDGDQGDGDGDGDQGDGDGDTGDGGSCIHQCMSDDDCLFMGNDLDLTCVDNFCTSNDPPCTGDEECIALYSGWSTPCTAGGGECDQLGQVCLDIGLCATPPSDFIDCVDLNMEEIQTTDIDGNPVVVCSQPNAVCNDEGYCSVPCQSDDDCTDDAYPVCDTGTGTCGCSSDADCATLGMPNTSVCNNGYCGCGEDQHCIDGNFGDVCTSEGLCGCSGDMACAGIPNPFDGGMISCIEL